VQTKRTGRVSAISTFHTNSTDYEAWQRQVYHDESECGYGKRIKADGNAISDTDGRRRCDRCTDLAAGKA
jgi:hypothetical protein